jgi:hemerythrin
VDDLVCRFHEKGSSCDLSQELKRIMVKWFVNHIQQEDKKINEYILSKTAG